MSTNKLCEVPSLPKSVQNSTDEQILKSIKNTGWMEPGWGIHRYYLRLLKQEARRRGLI